MDQRNHGSSSRAPFTGGLRESDDVVAVVDYMRRQPGRAARPLVILGVSLGTVAVALALPRLDGVAGVVLDAPIDDLTALVPMAVAGERSEMLRAQSFSSHRLQHPFKAVFDRCCSALHDPAEVVVDRIHQIPGLVAAPLIHPQGQSMPTAPCCAVVRGWSAHCRQTTPLDFCH